MAETRQQTGTSYQGWTLPEVEGSFTYGTVAWVLVALLPRVCLCFPVLSQASPPCAVGIKEQECVSSGVGASCFRLGIPQILVLGMLRVCRVSSSVI